MKKVFDRVLIVMLENQYRSYVMQDAFMRKLASAGANMTNFFGAFHPSQTNYVASLAGEVCGVTGDTPPASPLMQQTLVDVLEAGGVSWKAYMEAYPGDPWKSVWQSTDYPSDDQPLNAFPTTPPLLAKYFRKHNAFASFHTIQSSQERWSKIVDDEQFWKDVGTNQLPEYSWFTPDIWNDGHYLHNTHIDTNPRSQLVPQISTWLEYVFLASPSANEVQGAKASGQKQIGLGIDVDLLLTDPETAWNQSNVPEGTLIVITFDEADYNATEFDTNYDGPNQIYTVLLGDMIKPGTEIETPFNHYSLMKTIEQNFQTDSLGKNDKDANWFRFMWDQSFSWGKPVDAQIEASGHLSLVSTDEGACLYSRGSDSRLMASRFAGDRFSDPQPIGVQSSHTFAAANLNGRQHLVFADDSGSLFQTTTSDGEEWSEPESLDQKTFGDIAFASYEDTADGASKLMLCWQSENGFIRYSIFADGDWQVVAADVGQLTDGPMTLAQMGPSLYLVYKQRNTRQMRMTSFNLAPFNSFKAIAFSGAPAPENDTSLHEWSPADWPVGNFAKKMAALQNDYQALGRMVMATIEGEMHLVHRAAYADQPSGYTEIFGLTGIFTASNQMTNGHGTLDQAGWTKEQEIPWLQKSPEGGIAIASSGNKFLLVWEPDNSKDGLRYCVGHYS